MVRYRRLTLHVVGSKHKLLFISGTGDMDTVNVHDEVAQFIRKQFGGSVDVAVGLAPCDLLYWKKHLIFRHSAKNLEYRCGDMVVCDNKVREVLEVGANAGEKMPRQFTLHARRG